MMDDTMADLFIPGSTISDSRVFRAENVQIIVETNYEVETWKPFSKTALEVSKKIVNLHGCR
jgi:hypothetical protein